MELADLITTLGFPAAVAAFALYNSYKHEYFLQETLTKTIDENTQSVNGLKEAITLLKEAVDKMATRDKKENEKEM